MPQLPLWDFGLDRHLCNDEQYCMYARPSRPPAYHWPPALQLTSSSLPLPSQWLSGPSRSIGTTRRSLARPTLVEGLPSSLSFSRMASPAVPRNQWTDHWRVMRMLISCNADYDRDVWPLAPGCSMEPLHPISGSVRVLRHFAVPQICSGAGLQTG